MGFLMQQYLKILLKILVYAYYNFLKPTVCTNNKTSLRYITAGTNVLEPMKGFEPPTYSLRMSRSTVELHRLTRNIILQNEIKSSFLRDLYFCYILIL